MSTQYDREDWERDLFAARSSALPNAPAPFIVDDVFARIDQRSASRARFREALSARAVRATAWVGAAACAAASLVGVLTPHGGILRDAPRSGSVRESSHDVGVEAVCEDALCMTPVRAGRSEPVFASFSSFTTMRGTKLVDIGDDTSGPICDERDPSQWVCERVTFSRARP